jgi:diketogulonate reductase-like aldo/keto reductase
MYDLLKERGVQLASNQVEFSLLRKRPETTGLIEEAQKRGIAILACAYLVSSCARHDCPGWIYQS